MIKRALLLCLIYFASALWMPTLVQAENLSEAKAAYEARDKAKLQALADQGDAKAQYWMGVVSMDEADPSGAGRVMSDEAVTWFRKATEGLRQLAQQGDVEAEVCFRMLQDRGIVAIPAEEAAARDRVMVALYTKDKPLEEIVKAAEDGDADAQLRLGQLYIMLGHVHAMRGSDTIQLGPGRTMETAQAEDEGAKWTKTAAAQGHAEAQFQLGVMYGSGEGAPKSTLEAARWFQKAAAQGHTGAKQLLEQVYVHAALLGEAETVQFLLSTGADANAGRGDKTILMYAAMSGHLDTVQALLAAGADVNAKDHLGYTALIHATQYDGSADIVRALLDKGAEVNAREMAHGQTALMHAISLSRKGSLDIIRSLLAHGAEVNARFKAGEYEGLTPLMMAAWGGRADAVEELLAHGADPTMRDKAGKTALDYAIQQGHLLTAQLLDQDGTAVNSTNELGQTALMHAAAKGSLDMVQSLLAKGANIHAEDQNGRTALMHATQTDHPEVVQALLTKGAHANHQVKTGRFQGRTALMEAAYNGHTATVRVLLDHGADWHLKDQYGYTALRYATKQGHREIVELLKHSGAKE